MFVKFELLIRKFLREGQGFFHHGGTENTEKTI